MQIIQSFQNIFKIPELRNRLLWTFGLLIVFRLGSHVPLPGVNPDAIAAWREEMDRAGESIFHLVQVFSGGSIGNLAIFSLGIMPYITASIIMQLMTKVSPNLEAIAKEGPSGQRKIQAYTRYAAVPVCLVQGFFAAKQLAVFSAAQLEQNRMQLLLSHSFGNMLFIMLGLTAGSLFIMWLGEQITDRGVGNGASMLIMAGIVARMPAIIGDMFKGARDGLHSMETVLFILALYVAAIVAVVFVTQAQRRIPLQHAKHIRGRRMMAGGRNFLPIRVNTAGVMPVIFASSLMIVPQLLGLIPGLGWLKESIDRGGFFFTLLYVTMIFFFSYFWTYLFMRPQEISLQLKEAGSFVPGIRPGENTSEYLNSILSRITLCGAAFLCVISLLPDLTSNALGLQRYLVQFLGGTGILIVVGVALDVINKIESHLVMHHYGTFLGGSTRVQGRR
ncbi:MAG TPA: preprotein translocase subunit SecY [Planctomycetota bacterium]